MTTFSLLIAGAWLAAFAIWVSWMLVIGFHDWLPGTELKYKYRFLHPVRWDLSVAAGGAIVGVGATLFAQRILSRRPS